MSSRDETRYMGNPKLPTTKAQFDYVSDGGVKLHHIDKSSKSLMHFASNFFYIIDSNLGKRGVIPLHPFQKRIITKMDITNCALRFIMVASRQIGKALDEDTLIPTPNRGFVRMGDLKDKDKVFGKDGKICNVIKAHDTLYDRDCFEVEFDDGEVIIADADHNWSVSDFGDEYEVKTTKQLFGSVWDEDSESFRYSVPRATRGVDYSFKRLDESPYKVGYRIGEQSCKYACSDSQYEDCIDYIPNDYMTSSRRQRLQLLRGIMDACGNISVEGIAILELRDNAILDSVYKLLQSVGYDSKIMTRQDDNYPVNFLSFIPFEDVTTSKAINQHIVRDIDIPQSKDIVSIKSISSRPVRCITVDSEDSLFLCGENFTVTHNTTLMTIFALWKACFNDDQNILIVANKEATAQEIFDRVRMAYEELPNWLKPAVDGEYGKTSMKLSNGSVISIAATSSSAARGKTISCLIIDEMAFIDKTLMEEFWKSVYPSVSARKDSSILISSTPNGDDNKFHSIFSKAKNGDNNWGFDEVPWDEVPGRDKEWKRSTIEEGDLSEDEFKQEFECWFKPTRGASTYDIEAYKELVAQAVDPIWTNDDGSYRIFKEANPSSVLTVGVDVGEGVGGDFSTIQIIELKNGNTDSMEQIATYSSNTISTIDFTRILYDILIEWGSPLVFIERNNQGTSVIDNLYDNYNYPNIVDWGGKKVKRTNHQKGMISHTNTKYHAVTNMRYWNMTASSLKIVDKGTIEELKEFKKSKKNGKWSAEKGHDDKVMALIWALMIAYKDIAPKYFEVVTDPNPKRVQNISAAKYTIGKSLTRFNLGSTSISEPVLVSSNFGQNQGGIREYEALGYATLDEFFNN